VRAPVFETFVHAAHISSILTRIESAHPVICFCKVGVEEVWAGTFDSIIMLSNEGTRLYSTSTGAGRMIFIRLGTFPCAPHFARSFECLPHSFPHFLQVCMVGRRGFDQRPPRIFLHFSVVHHPSTHRSTHQTGCEWPYFFLLNMW
jgi:hypothetical protein